MLIRLQKLQEKEVLNLADLQTSFLFFDLSPVALLLCSAARVL